MFNLKHFIIFALFSVLNSAYPQSQNDIISNASEEKDVPIQFSDNQVTANAKKVEVKLYYESLCFACIMFDKNIFKNAVQKLNQYVDFHTYPYGNARTLNVNGTIKFECQHGKPECYGNKLHACAIDYLQNMTEAIVFNSCMMGGPPMGGSDDVAADRCAFKYGTNSTPIKTCAKGKRGTELLEYYGEETKKANLSYVPYILINGRENSGDHLMRDICEQFTTPPPPCAKHSVLSAD